MTALRERVGPVKHRLRATGRKIRDLGARGSLEAAYLATFLEAYSFAKNREYKSAGKHVWVHVGVHKTGSTTLQRQLVATRRQLRESSVFHDPDGYRLGRQLMWESPLPEATLVRFAETWPRRIEARRERTILLSCEGFFGIPYVGYSNTEQCALELRRILGDYPVDIIAVVRRQDRWTESTYQQWVRRGSTSTFEQFLGECGPYPVHWDELLDIWASVFGPERVHAHLFETTFRDGVNPFERVFGELGEPLRQVDVSRVRANPGVSETGLEVLRRSNDILERADARRLRTWLDANLTSTAGYRYFTDEERDEFMGRCAASNLRLFREYFPDADPTLYVPEGASEAAERHS